MKKDVMKCIRFSKEEAKGLQEKARKACLAESDLIRYLLQGYQPKSEPNELFFLAIKQLDSAKESAEEIIKDMESSGSLALPKMRKLLHLLERVEADMEESVLVPEKVEEKWR